MTKQQLIDKLASNSDIGSKPTAKRILAFLKQTITAELAAGNEVSLGTDFGTFKPVTRAARQGVNPSTGDKIQIAESKRVKFSISAPFKRSLNS